MQSRRITSCHMCGAHGGGAYCSTCGAKSIDVQEAQAQPELVVPRSGRAQRVLPSCIKCGSPVESNFCGFCGAPTAKLTIAENARRRAEAASRRAALEEAGEDLIIPALSSIRSLPRSVVLVRRAIVAMLAAQLSIVGFTVWSMHAPFKSLSLTRVMEAQNGSGAIAAGFMLCIIVIGLWAMKGERPARLTFAAVVWLSLDWTLSWLAPIAGQGITSVPAAVACIPALLTTAALWWTHTR